MMEIKSKLDEIVYLNVGGKGFTTSRSTLTQYTPSTLSSMFSGRWKMVLDRDNRVFIDRNGKLFERILEVLRDPRAVSEIPVKELSAFRREMDFYGLTPYFHHLHHDPLKSKDLTYISDFDKNGVFLFSRNKKWSLAKSLRAWKCTLNKFALKLRHKRSVGSR